MFVSGLLYYKSAASMYPDLLFLLYLGYFRRLVSASLRSLVLSTSEDRSTEIYTQTYLHTNKTDTNIICGG